MNNHLNSSLLDAAANVDTATVLRCIADSADINSANKKGWSPLVIAAFNQHLDTVKALVATGAYVTKV